MSSTGVGDSGRGATALTQELVRVDTIAGHEQVLVDLLAPRLASAGCAITIAPHVDGRCGLIAERGDGNEPPLTFTGHLDTVPLGEQPWTRDPFGAEIDGDRLYGRGASDMKAGVAAIVVAIERVADIPCESGGLRVILTAGEETGCEGARSLVQAHPTRLAGPLVVAEPTSNQLAIGHKGALWLRLLARGRAAHGSRPDLGDNAITRLARAICVAGEWSPGATHAVMGRPTCNVGTIRGGLAPNLVPDRATATLDIRTVAGMAHMQLIDDLGALLGGNIEITPLLDLAPVFTEPDDEWVGEVRTVCERVTGSAVEPGVTSYFTDAAVLSGQGYAPIVICGPGDPALAHVTDEYCSVTSIDAAVQIYESLARSWTAHLRD